MIVLIMCCNADDVEREFRKFKRITVRFENYSNLKLSVDFNRIKLEAKIVINLVIFFVFAAFSFVHLNDDLCQLVSLQNEK